MICEENTREDFQLLFSVGSMCTTDRELLQYIHCYQNIGFGFVYEYAIFMLSSVKVRADSDG